MLNIRARRFDLAQYCTALLDIWWNMLIKFSKQSCKNQPCKTSEKAFSQVVTGFRGKLAILPKI